MPFIEVKTNKNITEEKAALKAELGSAITAIPGKSEAWLMVEISDGLDMWFKGSDEPCVMFEVAIFGKASGDAYDDLTGQAMQRGRKVYGHKIRQSLCKIYGNRALGL